MYVKILFQQIFPSVVTGLFLKLKIPMADFVPQPPLPPLPSYAFGERKLKMTKRHWCSVALVIFVQWRYLFLFSGVSYFFSGVSYFCSVALVIFVQWR
jgi:hypothetical protein